MADVGVHGIELVVGGEYEFGVVREYPEASTQSFTKKTPVKLNTSGQVEISADTENYIGVSLEAASTVENTLRAVLLLYHSSVLSASQSNAGAAQASAQTQVGLRCSYILSTVTGFITRTVLDTADTGNANFEIIDLDDRDTVADTNGRVLFRPVPAKLVAR